MEEQFVVTRKEVRVPIMGRKLPKKNYPLTRVSSSFITSVEIRYSSKLNDATIDIWMISGRAYEYTHVPWDIVEGFYYAHSKGSYYNKYIKGKFVSGRVA